MKIAQVAQLLLPALLAVVERPGEFEPGVRRRALGIAHSMAAMLATVRGGGGGGGGGRRAAAGAEPLLDAWFPAFLAVLGQPTTAHVGPPGCCPVHAVLPPPCIACWQAF